MLIAKKGDPKFGESDGKSDEDFSSVSSSSDGKSGNEDESDEESKYSGRIKCGDFDNEGGDTCENGEEQDACEEDLLSIYVKANWAIVIPVCNVHHRHAERIYWFQASPRNYCNKPICDIYIRSRGSFLNKYPELKGTSKLLYDKHLN